MEGQARGLEARGRYSRRLMRSAQVAVVLAAVCALAGCGSSSSSTSTSATTSGAGGGSSSSSSSSGVSPAAQQLVTSSLGPVKFQPPGPAFKANKNIAGRTIYMVPNTSDSTFWANIIGGLKQAAAPFHVRVVTVSADGTTAGGSRGVAEATAQKASAIVIGSLSSQAMAAPIKAAAAAHIPVVMMYDAWQGPVSPQQKALGIFGNTGVNDSSQGRILAAEAVVANKGHVNAVAISDPEIPPAQSQAEGFVKGVKEFCPSCSATIKDVPLADWSTQLSPATTSIVDNPAVNVIDPVFTDMNTYVLPAIASHGAASRVKVLGQGVDDPQVIEQIKNGQTFADDGAPDAFGGWLAFDQVLRAWSGQPPANNSYQPTRLFDSSNVGSINVKTPSADWFGADWTTDFQKLWGVS